MRRSDEFLVIAGLLALALLLPVAVRPPPPPA